MAVDRRDLYVSALKMQKVAAAIEQDIMDFTADVVKSIALEVAMRTPIDTGTARSNWRTRVGSPSALIFRPYRPYPSRYRGGTGGSMGEQGNVRPVHDQAAAAVSRRKDPDTPVYITNNLPYIGRLDAGYSRMAPSKFVRAGVQAGLAVALGRLKFKNLNRVI